MAKQRTTLTITTTTTKFTTAPAKTTAPKSKRPRWIVWLTLVMLLAPRVLVSAADPAGASEPPEEFMRLIDIIVWRHVDDLKLSPEIEAKFSEIVKNFMKERYVLLQKRAQIIEWVVTRTDIDKMTEEQAKQVFRDFAPVHMSLNRIIEKEFLALREILTYKQLLRFYVLSRQLTTLLMEKL